MKNNQRRKAQAAGLLFALLSLLLEVDAQAASFDCAKAQTKVEHLICDNPEISKLDDALRASYKTALKDEKQANFIRLKQKQWMKERNSCDDAACVKSAYKRRLSSLANKPRVTDDRVVAKQRMRPRAQRGDWTYRGNSGGNEPLCHALLRRLNRYDRDEESQNYACSFPVLASYPKFTPPPWEELDIRQHEELLFKLFKYGQEGPDGYFHWLPGLKAQFSDAYYRDKAKRFIEEGGRLRIWRTRLLNYYRGKNGLIPAPPGEQTIVQMFILMPKEKDTYCTSKPEPADVYFERAIFIITPDLSGPDPNIDPGTHGILSRSDDLLLYEGKPLFINSYSVWQVGELELNRLCDYTFIPWWK